MAEANILNFLAVAGVFAVCVGIWFGVRGSRHGKMSRVEEKEHLAET